MSLPPSSRCKREAGQARAGPGRPSFPVRPQRPADHGDLPAGLTTIFPTMRGCIEQKYSYSPGAVKVLEKVSSVSRAADLNFPSFSRTVWGLSSALVQVTVVPGG